MPRSHSRCLASSAPRREYSPGNVSRPAALAQIAMALVLLVYVVFGVKSFIDARRARG